jgi:hypothetical protein
MKMNGRSWQKLEVVGIGLMAVMWHGFAYAYCEAEIKRMCSVPGIDCYNDKSKIPWLIENWNKDWVNRTDLSKHSMADVLKDIQEEKDTLNDQSIKSMQSKETTEVQDAETRCEIRTMEMLLAKQTGGNKSQQASSSRRNSYDSDSGSNTSSRANNNASSQADTSKADDKQSNKPYKFQLAGKCVKGQVSVKPYQDTPDNDRWTYEIGVKNTCGHQVSYRMCASSADGGSTDFLGWTCGTATGPNAAGWLRSNESRRLMPETWKNGMKFKVAECKWPLAVGNVPKGNEPILCGKCPSPNLCAQ